MGKDTTTLQWPAVLGQLDRVDKTGVADEEKREEAAHYERHPERLVEPVELLDSHEGYDARDCQTTREEGDGQATDEAGRHEVHLESRMRVDASDASPFSPEVDASHKRSQPGQPSKKKTRRLMPKAGAKQAEPKFEPTTPIIGHRMDP